MDGRMDGKEAAGKEDSSLLPAFLSLPQSLVNSKFSDLLIQPQSVGSTGAISRAVGLTDLNLLAEPGSDSMISPQGDKAASKLV